MKFKGSGSKGNRVIERKRSVTDGQTDRRTDGQTDKAKTICLSQRGGGDINMSNAKPVTIYMFKVNNTLYRMLWL